MRRLVWLFLLGACLRKDPPLDDDPKAAAVLGASALVKKGPIGTDASDATSYALVDVENKSAADRLITVGGELLGPDGKAAATLGADELRVPAHEKRAFALVADKPAPDGARATFTVTHAVAVSYPPDIELSDRQDKKGDLFVATARAKNTVARAASVVFACAYYDAAGKLLARPFTVVDLGPSAEQPLRFEGPKEAEKAVLFVGQVAFKP